MSELRTLNHEELQAFLAQAGALEASASLRPDGTVRMLGQLRVGGLEPGIAVQLLGAKPRDLLPEPGAAVSLSLILGDQAVSLRTRMLASPVGEPAPVLRVAWPEATVEFHRREEVRVAAVDLPSLRATLVHRGQAYPAELLNLTELGLGLGLVESALFQPLDRVEVRTTLPGGAALVVIGEVRHFEVIEDDVLPVRVGLVLLAPPDGIRDDLRRLIQARRMFLSQGLREG